MKKDYTHIIFLIDRSGSMSLIKTDMEGGIAQFLKEQKELPGKCTLTAAQFDVHYDLMYSLVNLESVDTIKINPRGGTALIDSMVRLISDAGKELSALPEEERPAKVLFVTITDGEENASREFTNAQLAEKIAHQEKVYNWQFTYIGANQDAFSVANKVGVRSEKTMNYQATTRGVGKMFSKLSAASSRYRNDDSQAALFSFTVEEQKDV